MNLFCSTSGIQQTNNSSVFGTMNSSLFGASNSSFSNMNLFCSTSGIQNSSVFGTMNSFPFGASNSSFSNMNLFGSTSGTQQTNNSSVFGTMNSSPFGASNSSLSNMNLFGSTSGIQQTNNSSVFGTMNSSPFGGPLAFKAAKMPHLVKHKKYLWARPLNGHSERNMTSIAWPMNLCCGPGMPMCQTPPYLDLQEFLHLVFQSTHTLAPEDLIPIPLANQQGAKEKKVQHLCSRALVLESQHLVVISKEVEHHHTMQLQRIGSTLPGVQTFNPFVDCRLIKIKSRRS